MRSLWLIYGVLDQLTGGYVYDRMVVEGLRRRGHEVDVVDLAETGLETVVELALEGGYDNVVGDELCHAEVAPLFARLRAGRSAEVLRLVLLVHHLRASETGLMPESERLSLERCDVVVATSHTTAEQVLTSTAAQISVCVPGADRLERVQRIGTNPHGPLRLLFVGTWTERKGLLRAIDYLRRLDEADFELHVAGDASRDPEYAAAVWRALERAPALKRRTHVLGAVSDAGLAELYARCDVLMLPSSYEGYGMVLTEALNAGVAVLVADVGATSEVVRHDVDGWLLPALDPETWAGALLDLVNDRTPLLRWSRAERRLPAWERTVTQFEAALTSVCPPQSPLGEP